MPAGWLNGAFYFKPALQRYQNYSAACNSMFIIISDAEFFLACAQNGAAAATPQKAVSYFFAFCGEVDTAPLQMGEFWMVPTICGK